MRKNYSFPNPTCELEGCPRSGKTMEHSNEYSYPLKGREGKLTIHSFVCPRKPGRHYAYCALPNGSPARRLGFGRFAGTDIKTGEPFETELTRKRGSHLMPSGQSCPQCGSGGRLRGPIQSERLGEPYWVLRCDQRHRTYYWKRNGKLAPLPTESLRRLHSRSDFKYPRCGDPKCKGFGRVMNPQKKRHPFDDGVSRDISHCQCRLGDPAHDVHLVLPEGQVATKEGWGLYSFSDPLTGVVHRTIPGRRPDRTAWLPPDFDRRPVGWQTIGTMLLTHGSMSNEGLFTRLDRVPVPCPYGDDGTWLGAARDKSCTDYIWKIRRWVKKPGRHGKPRQSDKQRKS